jgi:hypothetical protein
MPIEFGWAGTVDKTAVPASRRSARWWKARITRARAPGVLRLRQEDDPVKYVGGHPVQVGIANEANVLARYVGGDKAVISGLMTGADSLKSRHFAVDVPNAYKGMGRVIMFSNNPIYRWQNHGSST